MRRFALLGAMVLALMMLAGPALADDGSVLPAPVEEAAVVPVADEAVAVNATQPAPAALAETGVPVTGGALLAVVLLLGGGVALLAARRRAGS